MPVQWNSFPCSSSAYEWPPLGREHLQTQSARAASPQQSSGPCELALRRRFIQVQSLSASAAQTILLGLLGSLCLSTLAQTAPVRLSNRLTDAHTVALTAATLRSLSGDRISSDIELHGTARLTAGSTSNTTKVIFKAKPATGNSSVQWGQGAESVREVRSRDKAGIPVGLWSKGGKSHSSSPYDLKAETLWFSPEMLLARLTSEPSWMVVSHGSDGKLDVITIEQHPLAPGPLDKMVGDSTRFTLVIDPETVLPAEFSSTVTNISTRSTGIVRRVVYGDYRLVEGHQIPFHIEEFLNGSRHLDIRVERATVNAGLTESDFPLQ